MYLLYADESGDPGLGRGGTDWFVITGVIVHESYWNETFTRFLDLRRNLSRRYGIPQRVALHATDIVNGHGDFHHSQYGLTTADRMNLYREVLEFLAQLTELHVLNIFVHKNRILNRSIDVFQWAWMIFIQRFHNSIERGGALHIDNDYGLLVTDRTHDDHLRRLMRQMRAFNFVPNMVGGGARRILVTRILDDPIPRDSKTSYFIQIADLIAYALARREYPRPALNRYGFETYFDIVDPILLKEASHTDPQGIVYWPA